jgi:4-amino-4-deoxy-L-arabinose transferase-like glycosyltransferase
MASGGAARIGRWGRAPELARAWASHPAWLVETLALTFTVALALLARWPYLLEWPAFTDETREIMLSLAVARGERWPWTNVNTYIGPWHVYLLAGVFKLVGPTILAPRLLMTLLNAGAVGLTYVLARRVVGRPAGLVAGALVAISPMWVLVNSHVAWSANTTTVYVLAALLATHVAIESGGAGRRGGRGEGRSPAPLLVLAGLLLGIAGQTHPTGLLFAPAMALAVVWGRGGWRRLRTPWPWLALLAALVGYAPVLIFNLIVRPGASLAEAGRIGGARGLTSDLPAIALRAPRMWWAEWRMAAGVAEPWLLPGWSEPLVTAATLLVIALAAWGLIVVWRRGERLLPLALASSLLMPAVTGYTGEMYAERYAAPLVAIVAALVGVALASMGRGPWAVGSRVSGAFRSLPPAACLLPALMLLPLASLATSYGRQTGEPNHVVIAAAELLAPARGCIHVVLDQRLAKQVTPGGGSMARSLRLTLSLAGVAWQTAKVHGNTLRDFERDSGARKRGDVVVAFYTAPTIRILAPAFTRPLHEIGSAPAGSGAEFTIFTYRAASLPVCAPLAAPPPVTET